MNLNRGKRNLFTGQILILLNYLQKALGETFHLNIIKK